MTAEARKAAAASRHVRRADISTLPAEALSRPRATLASAERVLATSRNQKDRCYARQARGIALRELGGIRQALRELERAAAEARELEPELHADVTSSLATTLFMAGRSRAALDMLDSALHMVSGAAAARIRVRHGYLLGMLGRPLDAARELRSAASVLRRAGDTVWETRAGLNLAQAYIEIGDTARADAALLRVEQLLPDAEHSFEAAMARQDRGFVAALQGRIPEALAHYDVAARRYATAGARAAELSEARTSALLAAGLLADALASAQDAVTLLRQPGASAAYRAHALTQAGNAALAMGDAELARTYSAQALRLFRRQSRERGATLARLGVARARYAAGERSRRLLRESTLLAADAARHRMTEVVEANLLAGMLALDLHDREVAALHLGRARRSRTSRSDLGKVLGWRAAALQAQADGRRATALRACEQGLDVLAGHQLTLGATEMRAAATTHGEPLAQLALAEAVASDDAQLMLQWVERWRATVLRLPPVRSPDKELAADLARLRLARRRHDELRLDGRPTGPVERDIVRLETEVRNRSLRAGNRPGDRAAQPVARTEFADLLSALEDTQLVELFRVDDDLHVLVASADGVRHHIAGSARAALRAVDLARFTLRRVTHRIAGERARATLPALRLRLQRELLGVAVDDLGDGPLVVVPPAALSAAPWGLLPALTERAVSVMPSADSWLAARRTEPGPGRAVSLIAGPDLRHADVEVEKLAQLYPAATVLGAGQPATTAAVLAALDGTWLAHIAAHGTFRDDNPMFSSLSLDDGPLTVFDLQRLARAPHRLVLSCCDTGTVSAAGSDEMLGLMSALVPLGTAGMLAAVVPVSDAAAVGFGALVHDRLRAGASTASALRDARVAADDDPAAHAIAHAFVAFGAV